MKEAKFLCLICCLMMIVAMPCLAEEALIPSDGLYKIGVYSSSRMFQVSECVMHVCDGQMTAVITLGGDGYSYVYPGTAQEAADAPVETWIPYAEDWDGAYTYAIPLDTLDEEIAVAGYSKRYEKWYDRTLIFHSSTLAPHDEVAPDGVYTGIVSSNGAVDGNECILTVKGGVMTLETEDGLCVSIASLDKRIMLNESEWIMVSTGSLREYVVCATDGVYQAEVTTDSALLRFERCTIKADGGQMTAILTAKNNHFQYVYIGTAVDAAQDEDGWIPAIPDAEGRHTYIISLSSLDNELQIATFSAKKKMWYDRTIFIDSASLKPEGGE